MGPSLDRAWEQVYTELMAHAAPPKGASTMTTTTAAKKTITATLPDGTKVQRKAVRQYRFVRAAFNPYSGTWFAEGWTSKDVAGEAIVKDKSLLVEGPGSFWSCGYTDDSMIAYDRSKKIVPCRLIPVDA
jgi:hypothetical protein